VNHWKHFKVSMKETSIPYTIGNAVKQLTLKFTTNAVVQIMMDKYYDGQVVFSQNKWRVYLNYNSELKNADDIELITQILNERKEMLYLKIKKQWTTSFK